MVIEKNGEIFPPLAELCFRRLEHHCQHLYSGLHGLQPSVKLPSPSRENKNLLRFRNNPSTWTSGTIFQLFPHSHTYTSFDDKIKKNKKKLISSELKTRGLAYVEVAQKPLRLGSIFFFFNSI